MANKTENKTKKFFGISAPQFALMSFSEIDFLLHNFA